MRILTDFNAPWIPWLVHDIAAGNQYNIYRSRSELNVVYLSIVTVSIEVNHEVSNSVGGCTHAAIGRCECIGNGHGHARPDPVWRSARESVERRWLRHSH